MPEAPLRGWPVLFSRRPPPRRRQGVQRWHGNKLNTIRHRPVAASPRRTRLLALLLCFGVGAVVFLWRLGATGLVDETPPLFAASARGMVESGDWLIPHVNGLPRYDKPPLVYWLMALLYALPGQLQWDPLGSWAASLPSALASIAVMLALADTLLRWPQPPLRARQRLPHPDQDHVSSGSSLLPTPASGSGRDDAAASPALPANPRALAADSATPAASPPGQADSSPAAAGWLPLPGAAAALHPERTALAAALAFALCPLVLLWGRIPVSDALLCSLLCLALLSFWRRWADPAQPWRRPWLLLGLAVLTKGPVAVVLAGLTLLLFSALQGEAPALWRRLRPVGGLALTALVSLPWYLLALLREGKPFWESFFGYHNLQRFSTVVNNHLQPWWYFLPMLLVAALPVTPLLLLALTRAIGPLQAPVVVEAIGRGGSSADQAPGTAPASGPPPAAAPTGRSPAAGPPAAQPAGSAAGSPGMSSWFGRRAAANRPLPAAAAMGPPAQRWGRQPLASARRWLGQIRPLGVERWPAEQSLARFAASWLLAVLLFFTAAATKLPSYWLPATPAAALLVALIAQVPWGETATRRQRRQQGSASSATSGGRAAASPDPAAPRGAATLPTTGGATTATAMPSAPAPAVVDRAARLAWDLSLLLAAVVALAFALGPLWLPLIRDPELPGLPSRLLASGLLIRGSCLWAGAVALGWLARAQPAPLRLLALQLPLVLAVPAVLLPSWALGDQLRGLPVRQLAAAVGRMGSRGEPVAMVGILKPSLHFYSRRVVLYEGRGPKGLVNLADRLRREQRPGLRPAPSQRQPTVLVVIDRRTAASPTWQGLAPRQLAHAGIYQLWRVDRDRLDLRAAALMAEGQPITWSRPRPERY